jgi:uncharacterized protein YlxW (UPF0749 family)
MSDLEKTSLEHHVELCQMRYEQLDSKLNSLHTCLDKVSKSVDALSNTLERHIEKTNSKMLQAAIWAIGLLATGIGTLAVHILFK